MLIKVCFIALAIVVLVFFFATPTINATGKEITTTQGISIFELDYLVYLPLIIKALPTIEPTLTPTVTTSPGPTATPVPPVAET